MADISRTASFGKLSPVAYKAIEGATVFCKLRGNPFVELQHWLFQILNAPDSDLHRIVRHYEIDAAALARDLTQALDRLPRGASSISDISSFIDTAVERGWVYASLLFGESQVRSGHLLVGMLKTASLRGALMAVSRQFERVEVDDLCKRFAALLAESPEQGSGPSESGAAPGEASDAIAPAAMGKQEALKRFTTDLTAQARGGKMDPIVGRDDEIRQVVDILMRRRQNNPILVGEAGVGKTAVVEGFAQRIARGDVPPSLKEVELRVLDVGLLQAGASMKGEFEQRLRSVIDEVQASAKPIILFIDETHTLVGAGGAAGTGDAANLLKPALARGQLRTIGATTFAEYKKHIEKDPALTRRFQSIQVDEPTEPKATLMMRGVASTMEKHHQVQILDEALEAAVKLSHRYIPGAPAARQIGEPARHRLRARGGEPARHAGRGGRQPEAHRGAADRARDHRPRGRDRHRHARARGRGGRADERRAGAAGRAANALARREGAGRQAARAARQAARRRPAGGRHRQQARAEGRRRPRQPRLHPRRRRSATPTAPPR